MTDWKKDCLHWRGKILTGDYKHWCDEWDGLPVDETTPEWPCHCSLAEGINRASDVLESLNDTDDVEKLREYFND